MEGHLDVLKLEYISHASRWLGGTQFGAQKDALAEASFLVCL